MTKPTSEGSPTRDAPEPVAESDFETETRLPRSTEPQWAAQDPSWPLLADYRIEGVLGQGGMGIVYRAFDLKRATTVALKTVKHANPAALYRFKQEFRALLDVSHPNLVNLYDLVSDGTDWFFTMELVEGLGFLDHVRRGSPAPPSQGIGSLLSTEYHTDSVETLSQDIYATRLPSDDAPLPLPDDAPLSDDAPPAGLSIDQRNRLRLALRSLAEGVVALHDAGKLHRDLKPSNVLVTAAGRVIVLDFGLAADQDVGGRHQSSDDKVVGTAAYMAPEQAAGMAVSPASDWYCVGVMIYEALTGRLPFTGNSLQVLMDKQRYEPPPPLEVVADVPDDLNALCVDLLRRRPEARPTGREVLRRLGASPEAPGTSTSLRSTIDQPMPLVGRERHEEILRDAFAEMVGGRAVVMLVNGRSGMGKSALIHRFLTDLAAQDRAVVLAGRCYDRESVPYKALDSLIDALSGHLRQVPRAEAMGLLPRDVAPLTRVFPVLSRVEAVAEAIRESSRRVFEVPDPQELRRRGFAALRELLARMGDRRPLVLAIDDLQWGDVDSAALLSDLLRPPDPPVLLLLGCYRSEEAASSPFLRALEAPGTSPLLAAERRELAVDALTPDEARALAAHLLGGGRPDADACAEVIARESGGNPFFVAELVRHVQGDCTPFGDPTATDRISLDEVLARRVLRLPDEARRLLEVVAVAGGPVGQADAFDCAAPLDDARATLALLRSGRLIRSTGPAEREEVETYHDRVRESVIAHLPADVLRGHHRRLGQVLEASGRADPEALGVHFREGGEGEKAGRYFEQAAVRASQALAFDRAVDLYRLALELLPGDEAARRALRTGLGDALVNAGRGAEAAREYLQAARSATVAERLELQRRAAMQYLISGHIDDGLTALRAVLQAVGMRLPGSPRSALLSLLFRRALIRLRGVGFRRRDTSEVAAADLTRIDACWSAVAGLSVVDTVLGADFQARGFLLALRTGEPLRIARALTMEAAQSSMPGRRPRTARLIAKAEELAEQVDDPHVRAMCTLARATAAYLEGRWAEAVEAADRAEASFRDHCTGVSWELDTSQAFGLWALTHLGELAEVARRWPVLLQEARERGDLYAVMNLSTYIMSVVRLAEDDPDEARAVLDRTMSQWSRRGYHVQHNDALWAGTQIELYRGDGPSAWALLSGRWPALAGSLLLRVQFIRISMHFLRARAALAASAASTEKAALLRSAARDASRLEREGVPWASACGRLIRGEVAAARGDRDAAARVLDEAARDFDVVAMRLCAASARRRLGTLIGGEAGQAMINEADAWMAAQGIRNPSQMAAMYAPDVSP